MRLLPIEQMKLHVSVEGAVLVGAHEHNGSIWWSRLPQQLEHRVIGRDFESVRVDPVDRSSVV